MINFFAGVMLTALIFAVCFACCAALSIFLRSRSAMQSPPEPPEAQQEQTEAKPTVYYLASPKKPKRKRPKSNTIGLKGALMPKGSVVIADADALQSNAPVKRTTKTSASEKQDSIKPPYSKARTKSAAQKNQSPTRSPSPQRRSR